MILSRKFQSQFECFETNARFTVTVPQRKLAKFLRNDRFHQIKRYSPGLHLVRMARTNSINNFSSDPLFDRCRVWKSKITLNVQKPSNCRHCTQLSSHLQDHKPVSIILKKILVTAEFKPHDNIQFKLHSLEQISSSHMFHNYSIHFFIVFF